MRHYKLKLITESILEELDNDKVDELYFYFNDQVKPYYKKKLKLAKEKKEKLNRNMEVSVITSIIFALDNAEVNYNTVCSSFDAIEQYGIKNGFIDDPTEWVKQYRGG